MRVSEKKISKTLQKQIRLMFTQAIADLNSQKEAASFFDDFLSDSEFETFTKRLAVAYWLKKGRSYENIKENLKVSSATIASVAESLDKKGFAMALKKVEADEWANLWSDRIKKFIPNT